MSARSRRERTIGLLVSIVMLGLIGWAATHRGGTASEREASALAALEASGIDHARVRVDGMRVTVLGVARDRAQREDALREVGLVDGIRVITDRLTLGSDAAEPTLTDVVPTPDAGAPTLRDPEPSAHASPAPARAAPARAATRTAHHTAAASTEAPSEPCATVPTPLREQSVDFATASATVQGESIHLLATVAHHMRTCPETLLEVRGFADQAESAEANLMLSRQRARAVVGHLAQQGIAADRLVATYRGQQSPGGNQARVTLHPGRTQ